MPTHPAPAPVPAPPPAPAPAAGHTSIVRRVMGPAFDRLHPRLQDQFGFGSSGGVMFRAEGVMTRVWRGALFLPFLHIGACRRIMFPERGMDVPFTLRNYAYVDSLGRETLTFTREFAFPRRVRRFDETLVFSERLGRAIMYAGTRQHLAVDIAPGVLPDGSLEFRTAGQRIHEGPLSFRYPMFFSGVAAARQSYSEPMSRSEVSVAVSNPYWGRIFGYEGWYRGELVPCDEVPADCRPLREEQRE